MAKIKKALAKLVKKLAFNTTRLKHAQNKVRSNAKRAKGNHDKAIKAEKAADHRRKHGYTGRQKDKEAQRSHRRAHKFQDKAQWWVARVKELQRKIHHLDKSIAKRKSELAAYKKAHKVAVHGNKVTGGTPRQRLRAALHTAMNNCATGKQNNYYSMRGGARRYDCTLKGMPYGLIWDCSTFADGIYYVCGLDDPSGTNYTGGYTGTEGQHGEVVGRSQAKTGDLVLYGAYPHHHVEVVDDPGRETTGGHGSAPIDGGVFDLFGDGNFIIRRYLND